MNSDIVRSEPGQPTMKLSEKASSFLKDHFGFVMEDKEYDQDGKEVINYLLPSREGLTKMTVKEVEKYVLFMTATQEQKEEMLLIAAHRQRVKRLANQ